MYTVVYMVRKTTVLLRDDVHQALKEKAGGRNVSNLINKILIEYFSKKESMFGTMKTADISDLRDHRERA
jgi:predicted CopG family antitoxin